MIETIRSMTTRFGHQPVYIEGDIYNMEIQKVGEVDKVSPHYHEYLIRFGRYIDRCLSPDDLCNTFSFDEIIHSEECRTANQDILELHTGYNFLAPVSQSKFYREVS